MKKKILITGAGGYIGTELCEYLNTCGYNIIALDTYWFGNSLSKNIKIIKKDIRNLKEKDFQPFLDTLDIINSETDKDV